MQNYAIVSAATQSGLILLINERLRPPFNGKVVGGPFSCDSMYSQALIFGEEEKKEPKNIIPSIFDMEPKFKDEYGFEPSIRSIINIYYQSFDKKDSDYYTNLYIDAITKMVNEK